MSDTATEILRDMREVLSSPDNWTQKSYSRDDHGRPLTDVESADATSWCLDGAFMRCYFQKADLDELGHIAAEVSYILNQVTEGSNYVAFNDSPQTTHADILKLLDDAVGLAERESYV